MLSSLLKSSVMCCQTLVREPKSSSDAASRPRMSTLELLRAPNVGITLYIYAHVMLLAFAYTAISPVFSFTPVHLGGFGFTPLQISLFVSPFLFCRLPETLCSCPNLPTSFYVYAFPPILWPGQPRFADEKRHS